MYQELIKEICNENNIKYKFLSKNWIIKLEKDNNIRFIAGNKFDLNGHAVGLILDDKYALFDVLKNSGINVCEYKIFYNKDNKYDYAIGCNTYDSAIEYFKNNNCNIVIKPNNGSKGLNIYHITNEKDLIKTLDELFIKNYSISICPYYEIENEYRVIILNNEVKLIFGKIKPIVIGDGVSTLKELLINFNESYFKDKEIDNYIPKLNEIYEYDWKFNLSRGAKSFYDIDDELKCKLSEIAINVCKSVDIKFASVDIVKLSTGELKVLEANSGVTIDKVTNFLPNGKDIAKKIYTEAILCFFR